MKTARLIFQKIKIPAIEIPSERIKTEFLKPAITIITVFAISILLFDLMFAMAAVIVSLFIILRIDFRYLLLSGLSFLALVALLLFLKLESYAANIIIMSYYFLFSGITYEIVNFIRNPKNKEVSSKTLPIFDMRNKKRREKIYRLAIFPSLIIITSIILYSILGPVSQPYLDKLKHKNSYQLDKFLFQEEKDLGSINE